MIIFKYIAGFPESENTFGAGPDCSIVQTDPLDCSDTISYQCLGNETFASKLESFKNSKEQELAIYNLIIKTVDCIAAGSRQTQRKGQFPDKFTGLVGNSKGRVTAYGTFVCYSYRPQGFHIAPGTVLLIPSLVLRKNSYNEAIDAQINVTPIFDCAKLGRSHPWLEVMKQMSRSEEQISFSGQGLASPVEQITSLAEVQSRMTEDFNGYVEIDARIVDIQRVDPNKDWTRMACTKCKNDIKSDSCSKNCYEIEDIYSSPNTFRKANLTLLLQSADGHQYPIRPLVKDTAVNIIPSSPQDSLKSHVKYSVFFTFTVVSNVTFCCSCSRL